MRPQSNSWLAENRIVLRMLLEKAPEDLLPEIFNALSTYSNYRGNDSKHPFFPDADAAVTTVLHLVGAKMVNGDTAWLERYTNPSPEAKEKAKDWLWDQLQRLKV